MEGEAPVKTRQSDRVMKWKADNGVYNEHQSDRMQSEGLRQKFHFEHESLFPQDVPSSGVPDHNTASRISAPADSHWDKAKHAEARRSQNTGAPTQWLHE